MTEITEAFTLDIPISEGGISAITWLTKNSTLSKQRLKDAMSKGAVWLQISHNKNATVKPIRRGNNIVPQGAVLYLYYDPNVLQKTPTPPSLIEENNDYSIWNKPYGMLSHGSKWGDHCSITRWVEQHHQPQKQRFLVHRLDRAASGIMLLAHHKKSAAALSKLFETRAIEKRYQAIVHGKFSNAPVVIDTPVDNKQARSIATLTHYDPSKNYSLITIEIETGRKHQIRKHLSSIQHSIVGDRLYGSETLTAASPDLQLRSYFLSFDCPLLQKKQVFTLEPEQQLYL